MNWQTKKKFPVWLPIISTVIIPGSGYVLLGKPVRSLQMLFFMGFFGFVTYNLTSVDISPVGRFAGGFAVWVLSIMEVHQLAGKMLRSNTNDSIKNQL